ncbi:MAG: 6,7-dimethyl-8-ribityllumazine synthase [Deltaproteobacteria bacterium]|nr:6,7-dimethyl-8-ribityllumazine synthase [Deltaproteobacteria bacterium]
MKSILIIVSQFNEAISAKLLQGARKTLFMNGFSEKDLCTLKVPGAFELPVTAARAAAQGKWDAIICLGCLIQGETPHFEYISQAVAQGLTRVSLDYRLPVVFGVLTTSTWEQAAARASLEDEETNKGRKRTIANKGKEAAEAAIQMIETFQELDHLVIQ